MRWCVQSINTCKVTYIPMKIKTSITDIDYTPKQLGMKSKAMKLTLAWLPYEVKQSPQHVLLPFCQMYIQCTCFSQLRMSKLLAIKPYPIQELDALFIQRRRVLYSLLPSPAIRSNQESNCRRMFRMCCEFQSAHWSLRGRTALATTSWWRR